ncbi:hypothetical protein VNO77_37302 [Canavalia gladiata]|uniref:Uncharacterized protein n=1 Tax=Canavalia gladiata TaxID=3824 RepID=A0AAN9PWN3_CANGL
MSLHIDSRRGRVFALPLPQINKLCYNGLGAWKHNTTPKSSFFQFNGVLFLFLLQRSHHSRPVPNVLFPFSFLPPRQNNDINPFPNHLLLKESPPPHKGHSHMHFTC